MYYSEDGITYDEIYIKALDSMPVGTIVDYDGQASDIPTGWEALGNDYSTTEINTGKTWIDGKPIYRKVFTFTINDTSYTYTTDITTASISDIWINANSYGIQSPTAIISVNSYHSNNIYATGMVIDTSQTNIRLFVRNGSSRNDLSYKVILEYTKTTD